MKFITHILVAFFVFAIPVSAAALGWKYGTNVDEMTGETSTSVAITDINIEQGTGLILQVNCSADKSLGALATFIGASSRYEKHNFFDITARFDQQTAFDMSWLSVSGTWGRASKWSNGFGIILSEVTHGEKFLKSLRTSDRLRLRAEQQSNIYTVRLPYFSEPPDRVLRNCGRDDLIG